MRAAWLICCVIACKSERPPGQPDAALVPDAPAMREYFMDRATLPAQPGFSLHTGDGALWVRASTGVFRSQYEGELWTKVIDGATAAIEVGSDSTVIATRITGGSGNEMVAVERHANGSVTPLTVPSNFSAAGRWTNATSELDGDRLYINLTGRSDASTVAPAQLVISADRGDTFATLPGPPNAADVTAWGMRACDGNLAVWPLAGTSTASYVYREGAWEPLVDRPVLDVACAANAVFLVSTFTGLDARVYRVGWDENETRSETFTPVPAPLQVLAVGPNGTISSVSEDATTIYTSTDNGASFTSRVVPLPLSTLATAQAVRTLNGVWTMASGFPTWSPDLSTSWSLRGLPAGDGQSFAIDIGFSNARRVAAMYMHASAGGTAGYFLFTSEDAGSTWQVASNPTVPIACMSVAHSGVFLGGGGDDAGVQWARYSPNGARLFGQDVVRDASDSTALRSPIVGCGWTDIGVYIAQTEPDVVPISRLRRHTASGDWTTVHHRPELAIRVTGLDAEGTRVRTAYEQLTPTPAGYDLQAYRGVIELDAFGGAEVTSELDRNALPRGARAAIQISGTTALYPGNRVVVDEVHPVTLVGLPQDANISGARMDDDGTLWLATTAGLFRSVVPIGP